jgi:hypothetical protein
MDREDIIRMARNEYGIYAFTAESLAEFATLVAAEEREACAKFIEHDYVRQFERPWRDDLSAAIRARGQA